MTDSKHFFDLAIFIENPLGLTEIGKYSYNLSKLLGRKFQI